MTRLTVVADDQRIIVDGIAIQFDFSIDSALWAIQWNGEKGHIEYRDGRMPEPITDESEILPWIELYTKEKERQKTEAETAAAQAQYERLRDPEARTAEAASIRWQHQIAGVSVDDVSLLTDRESINDMEGIAARNEAAFPMAYKAASGFVKITFPSQAVHYAEAQNAHVQACFEREAELVEMIDAFADDPDTLAELDLTEGWPA